MARNQKTALALYCASLRAARGLTQADVAAAGDVSENAITNIERGKAVSLVMLAKVYRDGLRGRAKVKDDEWFQIIVYWVVERVGDGGRASVERTALPGGIDAVNTTLSKGVADLAKAAAKLDPLLVDLLIKVAVALANDPKEYRADLLTAFVRIAGK
jgi:transcriptional regulator with XRE-family HTH domain